MRFWSSWPYLAGAGTFLLLANGANSVPIAAWLAPILLLRFSRRSPAVVSIPIVLVVLAATFAFQFRGMFPVTGIAYLVFLSLFGAMAAIPYVADRLLSHRLHGWPSTLVFPSAWAVVELLGAHGPTATWGAVAYSQYGSLPLLQILSVTGMTGIAFLIGWTASVVNYAWERDVREAPVRRYALIWAIIMVSVHIGGGVRLTAVPPGAGTVRIAAIAGGEVDATMWETFGRLQRHQAAESDIAALRTWSDATSDDLLERSRREAQAGARIIAWAEASTVLLKEDENALFTRAGALASEHGIYLAMGILSWDSSARRPAENKVVMIGPDGEVEWEFLKARPVPGPEAALSAVGDGELKVSDTPFGRISAVVCFDADFPDLLSRAGALDIDILLVPSNDWKAITPWHAQMASYRGIEQGFQIVRPTSNGLSVAYDHQGRRLGSTDYFRSGDRILVAQIPTGGVRTLYAVLGNAFGWACLGLLGLLTLAALRRAR